MGFASALGRNVSKGFFFIFTFFFFLIHLFIIINVLFVFRLVFCCYLGLVTRFGAI